MSYQSLEELRKEHTDEEVFRAAMKWLMIEQQSRWRRDYRDEHGIYPSIPVSQNNSKQSRYYLPPRPKYRDIPQSLMEQCLKDCGQNNDCSSCKAAYVKGVSTDQWKVPCHDCEQPCKLNQRDDIVCVNASCFMFNT